MIWFLTSFTTFYFQKFVNVLRTLNRAYYREKQHNLEGRRFKSTSVTFHDDVFYDETDVGKRKKVKPQLTRRMSFAGGVDGTGQSIAILTSGGDSQGMNAAIRATTRMALYAGANVYAVYWGYQGLVDGGENIKKLSWDDVHGIIHKGGTIIGSARCKDFRSHEGRRKAALNLIQRGITNLVVIGGDGSLTGADIFRHEWKLCLEELVASGDITIEQANEHNYLNLVGMVGSIDNDFCGTDMTIGADTALHRILESVDTIVTTAQSHQRAFILEVMGRDCGYLALIAGISSGADWIFIPEWPAEDGWEDSLCDHLRRSRQDGRLLAILIIAEGAHDAHGKSISAYDVKKMLSQRLELDVRTTVLGHVQRGGRASAFDRLLGSRFGAEAALTVLEANETSEATVMCLCGQQIVKKPLHQCVSECNAIKDAYAAKDYEKVIQLRGRSFQTSLQMYKNLKHVKPPESNHRFGGFTFGVMNIGAPSGGMNPATSAFVRSALYGGHKVLGIKDGFDGLLKDAVHYMTWSEVDMWTGQGGSRLGVTRTLPGKNLELIAQKLTEYDIKALFIVGGFEAFHSLTQLTDARDEYDEFCIPMVLVPATLSNNVPGTWFSLGADTTLNIIVESCDRLRQSASSSRDRVFIVETMGGKCGYLATMAAIAGGANAAYIFEDNFTLKDLKKNIQHLVDRFRDSEYKSSGLILRAENCNENYTTDFITRLYSEEGKGLYTTRTNILGHVQQGGVPSPFDRLCGVRQAVKAFNYLHEQVEQNVDDKGAVYTKTDESACVLGHIKNHSQFTPVANLKDMTDWANRLPKEEWWRSMQPLLRVLARYDVLYNREDTDTDF